MKNLIKTLKLNLSNFRTYITKKSRQASPTVLAALIVVFSVLLCFAIVAGAIAGYFWILWQIYMIVMGWFFPTIALAPYLVFCGVLLLFGAAFNMLRGSR